MIGVFGGSGFYRFLDDVEEVPVATPYGPPSAPVRVGRVEGAEVAFMPRHGDNHSLPPHRINYRANVWAMREVGARRIVGPSACGSLKGSWRPARSSSATSSSTARTRGRAPSTTARRPRTCRRPTLLQRPLRRAGAGGPRGGRPVVEGGTVVVIQGPRFSTRAESRWYSGSGFDVINMTQFPECWLARELELCYANISLVTDYDVGLEGGGARLGRCRLRGVPREPRQAARGAVPGRSPDRPPAGGRLRHRATQRDRPINCRRSFPGGVGGPPDARLQRPAHDRPLTYSTEEIPLGIPD